jgi:hypothetical protein
LFLSVVSIVALVVSNLIAGHYSLTRRRAPEADLGPDADNDTPSSRPVSAQRVGIFSDD